MEPHAWLPPGGGGTANLLIIPKSGIQNDVGFELFDRLMDVLCQQQVVRLLKADESGQGPQSRPRFLFEV